MIKSERQKLAKLVREMFAELGAVVDYETERSVSYRLRKTESGSVSVTFYNAESHNETPWLACQLRDWPASVRYPNRWRGFDHWKQNCYAFDAKTAAEAIEEFRSHLRYLGAHDQPERVRRVCRRIARLHGETWSPRARIHATRLWNWIDDQPQPEPLWAIMRELLPAAFHDANETNSIIFTYA